MPAGLGMAFELAVAVMLVGLGVRAIVQAARLGAVQHGGSVPHGTWSHVHLGARSFALLPFVVGLVHGLAGSGTLAALVLATEPTLGAGVAMLGVYSAGTLIGMALLAGALGRPLQHLVSSPRAHRTLLALAGATSLAVGVFWGASVLA